MARENFHQQLERLKQQLLAMAGQAERSFNDSIDAYLQGDLTKRQQVIDGEIAIDAYEREVDRLAIELIAMEQPAAIDLRFILSIMRINSDLERIGDQSLNIAERMDESHPEHILGLPVDIRKLATHAQEMLTLAVHAFKSADVQMADAVLGMDAQVNELNSEAFRSLSVTIRERPETAPEALNALIVARNIERVADHATNIAEDVIFWRRGDDVRHEVVQT